jgi:curved DNA-binding protein CbpA
MSGEGARRVADLVAILGLPRIATAAEVRAARRQLAKRLHPDALVSRNENERRSRRHNWLT